MPVWPAPALLGIRPLFADHTVDPDSAQDARFQIVLADASSQAITKVTSAFGQNELPMLYLLGEKYIASLGKLAESENAKVVLLPGDLQNTLRGLFQKLPTH